MGASCQSSVGMRRRPRGLAQYRLGRLYSSTITKCFTRLVKHRAPVSLTTPRTYAFPIGPQPSGAYMIAGRLTARWTYFLPFTDLANHLSIISRGQRDHDSAR